MLTKILDGQTKLHHSVHKQLHSLTDLIQDCRSKIDKLKEELSHIARIVKDWYQANELIRAKEAEKKNLETQLRSIEYSLQQQQKAQSSSSSSFASRSTSDLAQSVFQPLPSLPHTPTLAYQPLSIPPNQSSSLFHPPHYQKLTPPPPSPYHDLISPPSTTLYPHKASSTPNKPSPPPVSPTPYKPSPPDLTTGALSYQPPNLFPLETYNPFTTLLHQWAEEEFTPSSPPLEHLDHLMIEKEEVSEPQVTEPMEEEASSIPLLPPPPPPPNIDQNRFFTIEDIPPSKWRARLL